MSGTFALTYEIVTIERSGRGHVPPGAWVDPEAGDATGGRRWRERRSGGSGLMFGKTTPNTTTPNTMTLATQVQELVRVLEDVVAALERFDEPVRWDYTRAMADRLRPLVAELEFAVASEQSRAAAECVLADISELMHSVNGAATKGEMAIFRDDTLGSYWKLSTVFRET